MTVLWLRGLRRTPFDEGEDPLHSVRDPTPGDPIKTFDPTLYRGPLYQRRLNHHHHPTTSSPTTVSPPLLGLMTGVGDLGHGSFVEIGVDYTLVFTSRVEGLTTGPVWCRDGLFNGV